jgi:nicotinate-nucleotide pyrophosphorylase
MHHREGLWDHTLVEASGGISESNLEAYGACGVDAISIGALPISAKGFHDSAQAKTPVDALSSRDYR